ncbi:MAG: CPBP family intramembrane metalloprotease [Methanobacterium sp. ERen5]|nr:MAG: CPBP family intramembrane metalloprotease [Methanobacterium sp. ERen5]
MSNIEFLNNAHLGKNKPMNYFLTIVITIFGGSIAAIIFIILLMLIYLFIPGINAQTQFDNFGANPLLILVLVGLVYGLYAMLFYLCIRFIHKKNFHILINTGKKIRWKRILIGAALWTGIMGVFTIVTLIFQGNSLSINFDYPSLVYLIILSLLVFPLQASFEEIFFRGYLMQGISLIFKKPVVSLVLTTVIFASIHYFNGSSLSGSISIVISAMILGLMLGVIVLGENGLETAVGVHIANNLFVAVVLNSSDSGMGNLPSLITAQSTNPYSGIPLLLLMALITLTILFWNKKSNISRIFQG